MRTGRVGLATADWPSKWLPNARWVPSASPVLDAPCRKFRRETNLMKRTPHYIYTWIVDWSQLHRTRKAVGRRRRVHSLAIPGIVERPAVIVLLKSTLRRRRAILRCKSGLTDCSFPFLH